jgi:RimJ/RimL family protein N-acetyltransferase
MARALTDAAFTVADIERVEIHHDKANAASGGVPARLGYTLLGEWDDEPLAPADVGIECRWAVSRDEWCDHEPTTVL